MIGAKLVCLECGQTNRVPCDRLGQGPKCGICGAGLMPGRAVDVDPGVLGRAARGDEVPLVVDFWAPWCGPCRRMAPEYNRVAADLRGRVRFVKLDTEAHPEVASRQGIRGVPTLMLYRGGQAIARQSGMMPAAGIRAWIDRALEAGAGDGAAAAATLRGASDRSRSA